jgi:YHS domain-containing protein
MLRALLELIVLLLVIRAVWRVVGSMVAISAGSRRTTTSRDPRPMKLVRDPVCGTYVSPDAALSDGTNYFCSEKCRDEFRSRATETRRHGASF